MLLEVIAAALLAPLTPASPWKAPERSLDRFADDGQGAGGPARVPATAADQTRVAELFSRQDQAILARDIDAARQDFADDFTSSDFHCDSSTDLLKRWTGFLRKHDDPKLSTTLLHAERVGDWIVADVRRLFTGVRLQDDAPIRDESVETHVLHDEGGRLRITTAYENEAHKGARIDRDRRVYDARGELCFQIALPEPFVPIPRRGPGAALDELLLVDPADDATLGMVVFDPTVDEPLLDLIWRDCADPDSKWLLEPRRFERAPPGMSAAAEAEAECAADPEAKGMRGRAANERAIYLSPDGRIVFAIWLRASPAAFPRLKAQVDQFARSLRLSAVKAGVDYTTALLDRNPRWNTVQDGRFRPESASVDLAIPPLMAATPLLGDHVLRLRLKLFDDPSSRIIVRFFPGGEDRIPADKILDHTVQRMNAFACAESDMRDSHRSGGNVDVLGRHGNWSGVDIVCANGSRRNYQIVAVDLGDCHVQVQVLPGSGNVEVQAGALKQVLDALEDRAAPPPASSAAPPPGGK